MSINIHLDADPVKIWDSAIDITSIKTIVDGVEDDLINAKRDLVDQEGDAVLAFSSCIVGLINDCQSLFADLASYQVALENLSSDLGGVEDEFTSIRESAITGGLTVVGEEIIEPPQLFYANVDSGDPQQVDEYNRAQARIKVWNGLIPLVRDARDKEVRARQEFTDACNAIVANPILNFMTSTVKGFLFPVAWASASPVQRAPPCGPSIALEMPLLSQKAPASACPPHMSRIRWPTERLWRRVRRVGGRPRAVGIMRFKMANFPIGIRPHPRRGPLVLVWRKLPDVLDQF